MSKQKKEIEFELVRLDHEEVDSSKILEQYLVNNAKVTITNEGYYLIREPEVSDTAKNIYSILMEALFYTLKPFELIEEEGKEGLVNYILKFMEEEAKARNIYNEFKKEFEPIKYYFIRDLVGYGIIDVPMQDNEIEELSFESYRNPVGVIHRKHGEYNFLDTNIYFDKDSIDRFVQKLAHKINKTVTLAKPIVDGITPEGDRVLVTYSSEVTLPSSTFAIRKFPRKPLIITDLILRNTISVEACSYLWLLHDAKGVGLIVGETGSGKTTLMNSLLSLTNPRWKVFTVEETPELLVPHKRWVRSFTRQSFGMEGKEFEITIMHLIKASLRSRPDILCVGEIRGEEAFNFVQAASTGHSGLCTFHADSPKGALVRLSANPINITESYQMLIWYIVNIKRMRIKDKIGRRVYVISELNYNTNTKSIELTDVFKYNADTDRLEPVTDYSNTPRVRYASEFLNVNAREDLEKRKRILEYAVNSRPKDISELFSILSTYYL